MRSVNEEISPAKSTEKRTHIQEAVGPHQSVSTGRSPNPADSRLAPRYHVQRNQRGCLAEQELAAAWLCRSFQPYARMRSVLMMRIGIPSSSAGIAPGGPRRPQHSGCAAVRASAPGHCFPNCPCRQNFRDSCGSWQGYIGRHILSRSHLAIPSRNRSGSLCCLDPPTCSPCAASKACVRSQRKPLSGLSSGRLLRYPRPLPLDQPSSQIHVLPSQRQPDRCPLATVRHVWPTCPLPLLGKTRSWFDYISPQNLPAFPSLN